MDLVNERTDYEAWQSVGTSDELGSGQGRLWRRYDYNRAGELARKHDGRRGATDYRYDPTGQLLTQRVAEALTPEEFAWDAAGNLLDEVERKSRGHVQGNRQVVEVGLRALSLGESTLIASDAKALYVQAPTAG